jgi:two-component system chemotaxis sensor kinase CheA
VNSFTEKFKDEVRDYCEKLETGLMVLEKDPNNQSVLVEIFRIMHSMKGSGGMFGFDLLSDVTHDLESLYELFRSNTYTIDPEAVSFTLKSIDHLLELMVTEPTQELRQLAETMKSETRQQIDRFKLEPKDNARNKESDLKADKKSTWFISFDPNPEILSSGTNPLYLVDELHALGDCDIQVSFKKLPSLFNLVPEECYTSWSLFIATSENIETLRDVFIFVSDHADIQIDLVSSTNVLSQKELLAEFLDAQLNQENWNTVAETEIHEEINSEPAEIGNSEKKAEIPAESVFSQTTVESIRVESRKIDQYMNIVSELITTQSRLELVAARLKHPDLDLVSESFGKLSRQLRDNAFDMSLIPLQSVAVRFNRLIHDLSKSLHKEVVLVTEGMETELDKNIIEKLTEPLLHIIRNSMDHGIETRIERLKKRKDPVGKLSIKASTAGSYVLIEIEDDGAGLDLVKIRKKAHEKGLIKDQNQLNNEEISQLIFESGFTTSDRITDMSGRGVGMDVVKRRIQEMSGMIELSTEKDKFTRFTIKLPLSLSIIDGLLTKVGDGHFVIPSSVIKKIHFVKSKILKKEFRQVIELDGEQIPYLNMHVEFVDQHSLPEEQQIVVIGFDNEMFGLIVDEVVHEYQAVIKPLGRMLKGLDLFSGASILGTGQLALVIDTNKMIKKLA